MHIVSKLQTLKVVVLDHPYRLRQTLRINNGGWMTHPPSALRLQEQTEWRRCGNRRTEVTGIN